MKRKWIFTLSITLFYIRYYNQKGYIKNIDAIILDFISRNYNLKNTQSRIFQNKLSIEIKSWEKITINASKNFRDKALHQKMEFADENIIKKDILVYKLNLKSIKQIIGKIYKSVDNKSICIKRQHHKL